MHLIVIPENVNSENTLTIQKFVPWKIDFSFLMAKATGDLDRIYSENIARFMENIMNFSITVDSMVDCIWHTVLKPKGDTGFKNETKYKAWLVNQHLYPSIFADFSNTLKHFDRNTPNQTGQGLGIMLFRDDSPELQDADELENVIRCDVMRDGIPDKMILSPRIIINEKRESLPFLPIAKRTLVWWQEHFDGL